MPYSTRYTVLANCALLVPLYPASAMAEVSDKEPTAGLFWTVGIGAALLCLFSTRIKPWLGIAFFAPATLWFFRLFLEMHFSDVGPYLRMEQGAAYYWQAYAAFGAVVCGFVLGYLWHKRSNTPPPASSSSL